MSLRLLKFEIKNLLRDRMTFMLLAVPLLVGWLGKYLIENDTFNNPIASNMIIIALTLISGVMFGSMAGFSILDDRDDHVFVSIQISPLSIRYYVWMKVIFVYVLSVVSSMIIFAMVGGMEMQWWQLILIALLNGFQAPTNAFLVNAFASNKVEGFVAMKATGFLMIFPIIAFLFVDWKEWIFAIAPAFWGAKALQTLLYAPLIDAGAIVMHLPFLGYLVIGFAYNILLTAMMYNVFKRKYMQ